MACMWRNQPSGGENPESLPTPEEKRTAGWTWEALREQTVQATLPLLEFAAFEPDRTLEDLVATCKESLDENDLRREDGEEIAESFEERAVRNIQLLLAEKILKPEMTVEKATAFLQGKVGVEMRPSEDLGVFKTMAAEDRRKRDNIPDLHLAPDVMYRKLSDIPEEFRDDSLVSREIEAMEEEHLGRGAMRWEVMNSVLHGLENTSFRNPNLSLSSVLIVLQGRMAGEILTHGESLSGKLLIKLHELIDAHVLGRSMTIPAAIEVLKTEVAKEPKLRKPKGKEKKP